MGILRKTGAPSSAIGASYDSGRAHSLVSGVEHEDLKEKFLKIIFEDGEGDLPPVFTWWAGERTKEAQRRGRLQPIAFSNIFEEENIWEDFPKWLADAGMYNKKRFFLPIGYHYVAFFYNTEVLKSIGVRSVRTWNELLMIADKLIASGVKPFALGSKHRWPAQFWFDFLMLRTAGLEYRARLMAGEASYQDDEVTRVLEIWKRLVEAGYFVDNAKAYTWADAADQVANGEAAMTLIGTWVTGYWDNNGIVPGEGYDFFSFPILDAEVDNIGLGPIDGWVVAANANNSEGIFAILREWMSPHIQLSWAIEHGSLPANKKADIKQLNSVLQRIIKEAQQTTSYAFNYDLATQPEIAKLGLDMFQAFMDNPANHLEMQADIQKRANFLKKVMSY